MKKFWVVMLSLGLIAALALPAAAAELRMSGNWYMTGWYVDNPSGLDKGSTRATDPSWGTYTYNPARYTTGAGATGATAGDARHNRGAVSYYAHRLTLTPEVSIVEGLTLKFGMDLLEGVMADNTMKQTNGGATVTPTTTTRVYASGTSGTNGVFIQENIEINYAMVDFKTALGRFEVGYVPRGLGFGTAFLNDPYPWAGIQYSNVMGPLTYSFSAYNVREYMNRSSYGVGQLSGSGIANDSKSEQYNLSAIYKMKAGEFGLEYQLWRDARAKSNIFGGFARDSTWVQPNGNQGWVTMINKITPYTKLRFGPAYVEAEGYYKFGSMRKYESFVGANQEPDAAVNAYGAYIRGQVDFKPFFAGATFIYMSGDDLQSKDKVTGSLAQWSGENYTPVSNTLILWNNDYEDPMGNSIVGNIEATGRNPRTYSDYRGSNYMDNVWLYQVHAGMNITPKLNVTGRFTYASADKKPKMGIGPVGATLDATNYLNPAASVTNAALVAAANAAGGNKEFVSDKYGTEFDLIATYKIYDNLSYTIGAGYLWTGDYFKGYDQAAQLSNNYILTHKLSLFF